MKTQRVTLIERQKNPRFFWEINWLTTHPSHGPSTGNVYCTGCFLLAVETQHATHVPKNTFPRRKCATQLRRYSISSKWFFAAPWCNTCNMFIELHMRQNLWGFSIQPLVNDSKSVSMYRTLQGTCVVESRQWLPIRIAINQVYNDVLSNTYVLLFPHNAFALIERHLM